MVESIAQTRIWLKIFIIKINKKAWKGFSFYYNPKKKKVGILQFTLKLSVKTNPFFYTQKTNVHLHNQL